MTPTDMSLPEEPYRGIEPFRLNDREIFVGREKEVWDLMGLVTQYRGVLLYGASGTGKSSLINAGLVPAALESDFIPTRLRMQPRAGAEFIIRGFVVPDSENPQVPHSTLRDGVYSVNMLIEELEVLNNSDSKRTRPLLIFDQFEELITLFDDHERARPGGKTLQVQNDIVAVLMRLLQDPSLPTKLLFVFREDYLARLNILFEQNPDLIDQKLQVLPYPTERLYAFIRAPFERLPGVFNQEISPELAGHIAKSMTLQSDGGTFDLTTLQIVCLELWKSADPERLFQEKGVSGVLQDYVVERLQEFPPELRDTAVVLLSHMITTANTRNIISGTDLIARARNEEKVSVDDLKNALRELTRSQLVRRELRHSAYFYEIVSEFLIPWIIHQKEERQTQQRLKLQREEGEEQIRKERRRSKRILGFVALLGFFLAVLSALSIYTIKLRRDAAIKASQAAAQQHAFAEFERYKAERTIRIMESLASHDSNAKLQAIDQIRAFRSENPELAESLLKIASRDKDPTVAAKALDVLAHPNALSGK